MFLSLSLLFATLEWYRLLNETKEIDKKDEVILEELKTLKKEEHELAKRFESFKQEEVDLVKRLNKKYDEIMAYLIQKDQNNNQTNKEKKIVSAIA